jgi:hypothetical protein
VNHFYLPARCGSNSGSGRIVKTELKIENPLSNPPVKGRIGVTYAANKALGILVPSGDERKLWKPSKVW